MRGQGLALQANKWYFSKKETETKIELVARPDVPDRFIDGHVEVIENNLAVSFAIIVRFHKLFRDYPSLDGTVGGVG